MTAHMTPDEFRRYGREVVDWIADYLQRVESLPVLSPVEPGGVRELLPDHPPEHGEPFAALLADLDRVVLPGITHWQHPSFFAYFPANSSGPAILGDLPARFGSGSPGGGVIQDTASSATLVALLAALHRASGGEAGRTGVTGRYAVYGSTQAHSSLEKAVRVAGLGACALRLVGVDPDTLALDPVELRRLVEADRAAGITPVMVMAAVGTTSTTAIDPVWSIGELCREQGIWLHVDAAYAGVAAICPEFRWIHRGVGEYADSYCTNPHKWLLTNFDCDAFWVADRAALTGALSILPEFLRNSASESGRVVDYRDWQVPLGRRFRALKLWAVIRWYGAEGLRAHIRGHVAAAQWFADQVRADDRFEIVAPHPLSLVCFRLRGADGPNEQLLKALNASGELYLSHTRVRGAYTLRMAIGATRTEPRHVEAAWATIQATAEAVAGSGTAPDR